MGIIMKSKIVGIFENRKTTGGVYSSGVAPRVWVGQGRGKGTRAAEGFVQANSVIHENNWFCKWSARAVAPKHLSTWTS